MAEVTVDLQTLVNETTYRALRKVFVGGLDKSTTEEDFKTHFANYGGIEDSVVVTDKMTGASKGFGFVTYNTSEEADKALEGRPHELSGKSLEVKRAIPRDDDINDPKLRVKKVFIGGLKPETTEEHIRNGFTTFGLVVTEVSIITTGKTPFAFATLKDEDEADKAIIIKKFEINGKSVEAKKAVPKDSGGGRGGRRGGRGGYGSGGYGGGYGGNDGGYGGYGGSFADDGYYGNGGGYGSYQQDGYGYGGGGGYGGGSYGGGYSGGGGGRSRGGRSRGRGRGRGGFGYTPY